MLLLMPAMPYFAAVGGGGGVFGTVYSASLGGLSGGNASVTFRQRFDFSVLTTPSGATSQARVTFRAGTSGGEGLRIAAAYIGHAASSGDAFDFASAPTQLLFTGSGSVTIPTGTDLLSDTAGFVWDKTSSIIVSFYCDSAPNDSARNTTGLSGVDQYFIVANDPGTVDATGYGVIAGRLEAVSLIEVDGF